MDATTPPPARSRRVRLLLAVLAVLVAAAGAPLVAPAPPASAYVGAPYFAPGKAYTQNFPDPSIVYDGATDRYWAFATTTGGVNVPAMWSNDLVTWTARTTGTSRNANGEYHDALPDPSPPGWPFTTGDPRWPDDLWAPGVGKVGDRWVMFYALQDRPDGHRCLVYATSSSPEGQYTDPRYFYCSNDPMGSIDPQPFTDPATGTTYLVWKDEGMPGQYGQRIWAQPITMADPGTVVFTPGSERTFLLESENSWEAYVAESPTLARLPDGSLLLMYSGNQWDSDAYSTGAAQCSGFGFTWTPRCTRIPDGPLMNRRTGRKGIGAPSLVQGRGGALVLATHSWAEDLPSRYPDNQRRMSVERLYEVDGRLVVNGDPGPTGPPPAAAYVPRDPVRVLDTRTGLGTATARSLQAHEVLALDLSGKVPATTTAVTVNLTVDAPGAAGFVSAYPCGTPPNASNLNFARGQVVPNLATVQVNPARRICLYTRTATHLVVDLQGTYDSAAAGGFTGVAPSRLLDTRPSATLPAGGTVEVQVTGHGGVPAGATAAALNLTADGATVPGYLTAWPCAAGRPTVSNVNYGVGAPAANGAVVPLSARGTVCVFALTRTDVVLDVFGFTGASGARFTARTPVRVLDTRGTGLVGAGGIVAVPVVGAGRAPAGSTSVVLTVTATEPRAPGWVSAYPCSSPPAPGADTSNLNVAAWETRAAHVTVPVGADGTVCLKTLQPTHLIADLAGSFS